MTSPGDQFDEAHSDQIDTRRNWAECKCGQRFYGPYRWERMTYHFQVEDGSGWVRHGVSDWL